ncbi:hypothetical protein C2G38_2197318 [Gigaspora rosea]|uniref:Uncharacterized protein n=1 Tax=Gigaspora rosea TaxID=44941 RepID=A0A397UTP1_9GLOM|nr:hypothetical protein C2G38_2197318 [Gigaspora rosea]
MISDFDHIPVFDYRTEFELTFTSSLKEIMEAFEDLDANLSESSNSSSVAFVITDNMSVKLTSGTELPLELEPNNDWGLQLAEGDSYMSWDEAEARLNHYAKAIGFSLR